MTQDTRYYSLMEQLTESLTSMGEWISEEAVVAPVRELCELLRVAKGITELYNSPLQERKGQGDRFVAYDSGEETDEVLTERNILSGLMIGQCMVYHAKGAEPWTAEDKRRIRLVQRMILSFISRARMQRTVEQVTLYDDVGYPNIRFLQSRVEQIGGEQRLSQFGMARFNLRHFSLINQELGRETSDAVMRTYIAGLQEKSGEEGLVCRLGGDNFVVLFRKDHIEEVKAHFEGAAIPFGEDGRVQVAVTAGVLLVPDDYYYHDFGDVMDRITNAYSAAKSGTAGEVVFSSERMLEMKERAMRVRQLFPVAMQNEELLVFYQPKINIENNSLVGAEALSRWYHNGRLIMPGDFIPVLEQSMDICKLDFYVLEHVCRDLRRWLDQGRPVVRISVNLSRRHLIDLDLLDHILEIVDRNRVPHQYVEIELTETTTDVEFKDLKRIVNGLQEAGIFTSVDDFGIGYSSLNLIRDIPWDILKVDKNFLPMNEQAVHNRQNIMFRHVVNMAREIGMTCIAEGVETKEQLQVLRNNGCDIAQGFFYDKPLPVKEFERRLDRHFYPEM